MTKLGGTGVSENTDFDDDIRDIDTFQLLIDFALLTANPVIVTTKNWFVGDGIINSWRVNRHTFEAVNEYINIPTAAFGTTDVKVTVYNVTEGGISISWTMIDEDIAGKEGLGILDSDSKFDPDVHYNANGDEFVLSKWMKEPLASVANVTDEDFDTGISRDIIQSVLPVSNPPNEVGQMYQDVKLDTLKISVNIKSVADWKTITLT